MTYNLYIRTFSARYNLLTIPEQKLSRIIEAYKKGESKITLTGTTHNFDRVAEFRIFTNNNGKSAPELWDHAHKAELAERTLYHNWVIEPVNLLEYGEDVTESFIGDIAYGSEQIAPRISHGDFISRKRIEELRSIVSEDFDLRKLVQLCEDLNANYDEGRFLVVGMVGRAILDHVPPIFGCKTFNEVENNISGGKSFKASMTNLNKSLRNIGDSFLHIVIRKRESLPEPQQVDFKADMDFLLGEIVRQLK